MDHEMLMSHLLSQDGLSNALGSFVIFVSFSLKVPLIINCLRLRSTKGIIPSTFYFEILALVGQIIYNLRNDFPLTTWGELLSVLVQDCIVVGLIWWFSNVPLKEMLTCCCGLYIYTYLGYYELEQRNMLWILPAYKTVSSIFCVLPQVISNANNGHTGALSATSQFFIVMLRCIRVYTTFIQAGDKPLLLQYGISSSLNLVLFLQIIWMRKNTSLEMQQNVVEASSAQTTEPVDQPSLEESPVEGPVSNRLPESLSREIDEMKSKLASTVDSASNGEWKDVVLTNSVHVQQHRDDPFHLKIRAVLNNTPDTCFSVLTDIKNRKSWDENTDELYIIDSLNPQTRVLYSRGFAIWPVAARDLVLLSVIGRLGDRRLVNVLKSREHRKAPVGMVSGVVRAEAKTMGTIMAPLPADFQGFDGSGDINFDLDNSCLMSQIAHVNPQGNIPGWVVSFVLKTTIPKTIGALNEAVQRAEKVEEWQEEALDQVEPSGDDENGAETEELRNEVTNLAKSVDLLVKQAKRNERLTYMLTIVFLLYVLFRARK